MILGEEESGGGDVNLGSVNVVRRRRGGSGLGSVRAGCGRRIKEVWR